MAPVDDPVDEPVEPAVEPEAKPDPAPLVVLECQGCGFDYTVDVMDGKEGVEGAMWACSCGSRYIPPGGEMSHRFVRP